MRKSVEDVEALVLKVGSTTHLLVWQVSLQSGSIDIPHHLLDLTRLP